MGGRAETAPSAWAAPATTSRAATRSPQGPRGLGGRVLACSADGGCAQRRSGGARARGADTGREGADAGGREAPAGPLSAWPSRRSRPACSQKAQLAPWTQLSAWPLSCLSVGGRHVRYAVRGTSTPGTWQRPQSPAARDPTVARGPPLCAALGQTAAWAGPAPASPPGRPQCHDLPPDSVAQRGDSGAPSGRDTGVRAPGAPAALPRPGRQLGRVGRTCRACHGSHVPLETSWPGPVPRSGGQTKSRSTP